MHELAITQNILSIVLEQAKSENATRITKIEIALGRLSGIVDECVETYFEFLCKDTIASGAALTFIHLPAKLRCRECGNDFEIEGEDWLCPTCHQPSVEILSGRENYVNSIEVD